MTTHHNQQLFSDHYLDVTLPEREDWQTLASDPQTSAVMQRITAIFQRYKPTEGEKEAQTEERCVKPVLRALGHVFEVQPSLATPGRAQTPDYVFYRDEEALEENKGKLLNEALLAAKAYAVGDAKSWKRSLDQALRTDGKERDLLSNKNPSYQIAFYMQQSGLEWGILTNGRHWRLYHFSNAHKLDHFYEVDLPALLASGDIAAFLYFYAFFRRAAFEQQPLGIAALLKESVDYAQGISESLKDQVYQALRSIAQGFLDHSANGLAASDPATLKDIYDSSLILLYRLLFIFYAEARNLLPIYDSDLYRERYSLYAMTRAIAQNFGRGVAPHPTSTRYYRDLKELFGFINVGDPPLKISTFNGGLFDSQRHAFLERNDIGDARLQQAVDMLARVHGQFIDYRDLSVRNLGTIYEGLLEYHLDIIEPQDSWTISLLNSRGEQRKATGSYYTPDFIVKYIVDATVGPVLQQASALAANDKASIAAILATRVLDPSMGSGHFLVEATEYIARFLVELNIAPEDGTKEADLAYWKRRVVQSCIYGVDLNNLAVELAKLSLWLSTVAKDRPLSFLDHHLRTGNSLIGTRLADLTVAPNGNGTPAKTKKAEQTATPDAQLSLFHDESFRLSMSQAVDLMWLVEDNPALTVSQVKQQEHLYSEMRGNLNGKYGALANLYTATRYGVAIDPTLWKPLMDFATGRIPAALPQFSTWLSEGSHIAQTRHFFHWELEFPEVFFDKNGQPKGTQAGFDAVVGNPPWIRQEMFSEDKTALKRYLVYHGVADLYTYFVELGNTFLKERGRFGFIIPNKFVRANYGGPLRKFLTEQVQLERLVDFGDLPVFAEAVTYPMIVLTSKQSPSEATTTSIPFTHLKQLRTDDLASAIEHNATPIARDTLTDAYWSLDEANVQAIIDKMKAVSTPLGQLVHGKVYRGILTGFNEAFVIDRRTRDQLIRADANSADLIKPFLVGEDIKRYRVDYDNRYIILTKIGTPIEHYPAVFAHLQHYQEQLEKRWDKGHHWWELRACDYYEQFEQPKIIYPNICKQPEFAYDANGYHSNQKTFIIPTDDKYLLTVLNSQVMKFLFSVILPRLRGGFFEPSYVFMKDMPIRRIETTTPDNERTSLTGEAITLYTQNKQRDLLTFIEAQLAHEPERGDVVRDILAHLAEQMSNLQAQRHEAIGDFRIGLQGVLTAAELGKLYRLWTPTTPAAPTTLSSVPAADSRDKRKKRAESDEMLDVLGSLATQQLDFYDDIGQLDERQWLWLFKHKFGSRSNMVGIAHVYRNYHPRIAAVDERLRQTDRMINTIVYKLYGLTPEEEAIVEGR
ncbi:MAG TPA: TaqI-like C-terminal specificity domain-containing protein [Ktedonobacteraceae bacterium]|nr:TaqI-like C-terminal specificity domain-containing protein [Ktedonobacteraceae bacterium]